MPLKNSSLKEKLDTELKAQGFVLDGEFSEISKLALSIANAIVDEITANALVSVPGGSSAGQYKVT